MRDQHGLIARWQLLDAGVAPGTVRAWVHRSALEVVEHGVYRSPAAARPPVQHVLAAVLRCGAEARAGGWTACALRGLEGFSPRATRWVVVAPAKRIRGVRFIVQRTTVAAQHEDVVDSVPTLSACRALVDTAGRVKGRRLRVAVDDARRKGLLTLDELLGLATTLPKHPGAAEVRRMFGCGVLDQDGEAERWLAVSLAARGIFPLWSAEVLPGVFPDAALPEAALAVECDGDRDRTLLSDRASDATRESLLRGDGWEVLRFTGSQLRRDVNGVVDRILAVRSERIRRGLGMPDDWRPLTPGRRLRPPRA